MKTVKVGINGGGRIGRIFIRCVLEAIKKGDRSVEVVAVNDLFVLPEIMAYLIRYDSTHGRLAEEVKHVGDEVHIGDYIKFKMISNKDPAQIEWKKLGVDFVIESTGVFTKKADAEKHLAGGAKKVIISAPSDDAPMFVYGVNHDKYNHSEMNVVSNASCTTNCLAPLAKIIDDSFGIESGLMTTVHAMTATQMVVDGPARKDLRSGRAASVNIIPASTGAAQAVGKVIPSLNKKLTGMAFRNPTINVSVVDLVVNLKKPATSEQINSAVKSASEGPMKGIVDFVDYPAVSSDFCGTNTSCAYDSQAFLTFDKTVPQTMVKLIAWYDNERGYSARLLDLIRYMASKE